MQPLPSPTVPSWGERLGSQNRAGYTPGPMGPKRTREAETDSTEGPGSEVDRRGLQWYHSLRVPRLPLPACAGRKWGPLGARAWGGASFSLCPQRAFSAAPLLTRESARAAVGKVIWQRGRNGSKSCLAPSPDLSSRSLRPCPPGPKGAGYLTPGWLAPTVPGRGAGVGPEAALTRERRHVWRRLQGHVGFGEGGPRRTGLLRQREARALEGRRAAAVRTGEKSISRGQTTSGGCGVGPCTAKLPPAAGRELQLQSELSAWLQGSPRLSPHLCTALHSSPSFLQSSLLVGLTITLGPSAFLRLCFCHLSCL